MAGWFSVLKMVPWADVISNAPHIADAARKLWGNVARRPPPEAGAAEAKAGGPLPSPSPIEQLAQLQSRLDETEAAVVDLHGQMVESTQLIDHLATQNALLVSRVQAHRVVVRWLVAAVLVLAAAVISLWWSR